MEEGERGNCLAKGTQRSELPVCLAVFLLAFIPVASRAAFAFGVTLSLFVPAPLFLQSLGRGLWGATLGLKLAKETH